MPPNAAVPSRRAFVARGHRLRSARNQPARSARAASLAGPRFWPDGARLPILISLVWESGSEPPETLPAPPGTTAIGQGCAIRAFRPTPMRRMATRKGLPRLLELLQRNQIHATAFILCGKSTEAAPALAREIAQRGHECAAHGFTHDAQYQLSRDDERAFISNASDLIAKMTGRRPVGWNCRGSSAQRQHHVAAARARLPLPHRRLQPR